MRKHGGMSLRSAIGSVRFSGAPAPCPPTYTVHPDVPPRAMNGARVRYFITLFLPDDFYAFPFHVR